MFSLLFIDQNMIKENNMHRIPDLKKICIKALDLPIIGNGGGNTACLKRSVKESLRATPRYGQANEPQTKHPEGIRSGTHELNLIGRKEMCSFYIVNYTLGIPGERQEITLIKGWRSLSLGYRGEFIRNSRHSKAGNGYECRDRVVAVRVFPLIRPLERAVKAKTVSGTRPYSTTPTGLERLRQLIQDNLENDKKVNKNLLSLVGNVELLKGAYMKIKSGPGNMTPGPDGKTLDGISVEWLENLGKEVCTGVYRPNPSRRVNIPKLKGGTRPLGVASPRNKIVQEAVRVVLSAIFEPTFLDCSHGFRPGRSCHSALKQIKNKFGAVTWMIEGDISKCCDSIDHHVLKAILAERISDKGFFDLYWKLARAGYLELGRLYATEIGTPQGSVVSPLLSNIFLHKFDLWMETKRENFEIGSRRRQNPRYTQLTRVKGGASEARKRLIPSKDPMDPGFKRLRYVRYADDFIIGIIGSKNDAATLVEEIHNYLKDVLKLELNLAKTKITHAGTEKAFFLGTWIRVIPVKGFQIKRTKIGITRVSSRPQLRVPLKMICDKLERKGIIHQSRKTPTRLGWLTPFTEIQIVSYYNSIYRGLINYYSFVDDRSLLQRVYYILKTSCALTLASKMRLKTKRKVYQKYGKDLTVAAEGKRQLTFERYSHSRPQFSNSNYDPFRSMDVYFSFRSKPNLLRSEECCICGSKEKIEFHHVRHLRKTGQTLPRDFLQRSMSQINRKQIPVCQKCHIKIHKGKYDGSPLKTFPGG